MQDFEIKNLRVKMLLPFTYVWENYYKIRRHFYNFGLKKQKYFDIPIISIGNLTFGGAGKTPFTIWLGNKFIQHGLRPIVLLRGYKGKYENGYGILRGDDRFKLNPELFGDEAVILAKKIKNAVVVVGKNRSQNLDYFLDKESSDVVILDDGFQHLKIFRHLNLVLFDATLPFSRYHVAPIGYLREGLSALKDANALIITRCDQVPPHKIKTMIRYLSRFAPDGIPIAQVRYRPLTVRNLNHQKIMGPEGLKGKKVVALAGVAVPHSFFDLLKILGANLIHKKVYPDHYNYLEEDVNEMIQIAEQNDCICMTTEKDIVKIRKISLDERILYLEVGVEFKEGEELIWNLIKDTLLKCSGLKL